LLTSISYRAKARKKDAAVAALPCCWTAPPGGGKHRDRRRADPVQVETFTPQPVRRVCTAGSVSALASDPHMIGADPVGLA